MRVVASRRRTGESARVSFPHIIGGHTFARHELVRAALTHPSAQRRSDDGAPVDSERLEFLGDAVLGLVLADMLFEKHPGENEGDLSRRRAAAVSRPSLATVSRRLGLPALIDAGDDAPAANRICATDSAAENAFEAMVGAVYRDAGFPAAREFVRRALGALPEPAPQSSARNRLQEWLQARSGGANVSELLEYRTVSVSGPAHARRHVVEVWFDGGCRGRGEGGSVKAAAEIAAREALENPGWSDC